MFHSKITIKEGAIFVADAHYSYLREELYDFLEAIKSYKILTKQLFFMGDIFDALFGEVKESQRKNVELIELINSLSKEIEIIYFEGNHDFNLQSIFPNIQIFSINQQPLLCNYENKKILLSHGDFNAGIGYRVYTSLIRNHLFLSFLSFVDALSSHSILKKLDAYLEKKDDCKTITNFEEIIAKRELHHYNCDYFIEGHYHQNRVLRVGKMEYINLGAFACNQRYFIVKSIQNKALLEEKSFSKREKI